MKLKNIKQQIPLKELGNTKDISEAVKFLIQNEFKRVISRNYSRSWKKP